MADLALQKLNIMQKQAIKYGKPVAEKPCLPKDGDPTSLLVFDPSGEHGSKCKVVESPKPEPGFFETMQEWSQPYDNGQKGVQIGECAISSTRGAGSLITNNFSTPEKAKTSVAVIVGTAVLAGLGIYLSGGTATPFILGAAGVSGAGIAGWQIGSTGYNIATSDGSDEQALKNCYDAGEATTSTGLAALAGVAPATATPVDDIAGIIVNAGNATALAADNILITLNGSVNGDGK